MLKTKDKIILFPLWLLTLLPLRILYGFSFPAYVLVYYIAGYRKKMVHTNLKNSFPEKSEKEIRIIQKKFYKWLCDFFFESLYILNMNLKENLKRYHFVNPEVLDQLYDKNKNFVLYGIHYGNWEWSTIVGHVFKHRPYVAYQKLKNKTIDRLFKSTRRKYGAEVVNMKHIYKTAINLVKQKKLFCLYLLADQRPGMESLDYWTTFLNQETPIITGPEKIARKFNMATVFMETTRKKRGRYEVILHVLNENPNETKEFEITRKFVDKLEEMIRRNPEMYLWSHNRWKFKKEDFN
jgi:Kdo2-lipid IVA lauroyltransferase/acyltransferase